MGHPRFSLEEIGRRGQALYEQSIRPYVETDENIGKQIVIDIETGDYEIDDDGLAASRRLLAKHPGAALYELMVLEVPHRGDAGCARHRVMRERLRMHEGAGALGHGIDDALGRGDGR